MRLIAYISFLAAALICSVVHVLKQSKTENSPGQTVLQTFFMSFAIIGVSSLWVIFTEENEISRAFGLLINGAMLGILTEISMKLAFYINRHRENISQSVKNSEEHPSYS